jgi:hypothetical protein
MSFVMTSKKNPGRFRLKWTMLLALGLSSDVFAVQCPAENFEGFVKVFSAEPEVQHAFTTSPIHFMEVVAEGREAKVVEREVETLGADELSMLSPEAVQMSSLAVMVQLPNKLFVRNQKGDLLKILTFQKTDCWSLSRVENWSLGAVLNSQIDISSLPPGVRSLRRGEILVDLAMEAAFPASTQLYISALDSYLDGADKGSTEAGYQAVLLSLSGQAPRLENSRILELLFNAASTSGAANLALANFYCDGGRYDQARPCADPEKSLNALEGGAKLGSMEAMNQLGLSYERGSLGITSPSRALACFQAAADKGFELSKKNAARLIAENVKTESSLCFKQEANQ